MNSMPARPHKVLSDFLQPDRNSVNLSVPFPDVVNAPLWTLKYEIAAYAGLALAHWCGFPRSTPCLWLLVGSSAAAFAFVIPMSQNDVGLAWPYHVSRFGFCFLFGVLTHHYR
jgi:peptidoglycan/LPS O-acetylase OafA/YrhL